MVQYRKSGVMLEGWTEADSVAVRTSDRQIAGLPDLPRKDVASALGMRADVGFQLALPGSHGDVELELKSHGQTWTIPVPQPDQAELRRAKRRLRLRFLRDLARAAPHLSRAARGDDTARARVKSCLRLATATDEQSRLEDRMFDCTGLPAAPDATPITIVLPVYNAFELLSEALGRIVEYTDLPWHLILVEDASPDPRVRPFLRDWSEWYGNRVTLLENKENLGFIGAVNRGLELAIDRGDHVVLLNSDAFVPAGWASRLMRPVRQHARVASVTPLSNDATIMTAPVICERIDLSPGVADAADATARRFNPEALLTVMPTGIGFCMAMNIEYLRRIPRLDQAFGRGYGEEVDWCQRARALGGRHLGLPGLFVEHRGGESFGSDTKRALVRRNNQIVSQRYPTYDAEVQRFIADDPMRTARLALGIAMIAAEAKRAIPIYVAHSMGGGAETYLQQRIRGDLLSGPGALVLRLGGRRRWRLELHSENGVTAGDTDMFDFVEELLAPIAARRLVYSCAVGDPDPVSLPDQLLRLLRDGTPDRLEILVHDFFMLSPSYTLLDSDHIFRGPVETDRADRAHRVVRPDGRIVGLEGWRAAWSRLLFAAHEVVVFSQDSQRHMLAVFPALEDRLIVRPHSLHQPVSPVPTPGAPGEVVAVLGNIGVQKGAALVARLALRLQFRADQRLVIVGSVDPAFELAAGTIVTGAYQPRDIARLAAELGVTRWLIPSIWPETFSYTTHEALATGLPVHAFDIGAQGDAVAKAPNGIAVPFDPSADLVERVLASIVPPVEIVAVA
ncbi:MAG: glycosyltransferase [Pseudomonadota bacterium]